MDLTHASMGIEKVRPRRLKSASQPNVKPLTIALAGNPNVGKSTVFNALTGMNQHTGNWPGKTVIQATGRFAYGDKTFTLVDLPGTYSLLSNTAEEEVARDYICYGGADAVVVVADATCLERNLNLVLQIAELTDRVIFCVNLADEAARKGISIDTELLEAQLGIPVVLTAAKSKRGLDDLKSTILEVATDERAVIPKRITYRPEIETALTDLHERLSDVQVKNPRWTGLRLIDGDAHLIKTLGSSDEFLSLARETAAKFGHLKDFIIADIYGLSKEIASRAIAMKASSATRRESRLDDILTSRVFGLPVMLTLLGAVFWITVTGANIPSEWIAAFLFWGQEQLTTLFTKLQAPDWLHGIVVLGVYRTLAWVVSVMLPPMAIFFPIFTLLEDYGYLARVSFNLDSLFKRCGCHGKQALTMCMGFGCNACGVIACRIIDSPRERLIAILTNNFVICNGRFPTQIALATILVGASAATGVAALSASFAVVAIVLIGIAMTLAVSWGLNRTVLKGVQSTFTLELPPYRPPQIVKTLVRSIFDRTVFVLMRAIVVAAPAGAVIWLLSNITMGDASILTHLANALHPIGNAIGLDGFILCAFILGLPANEIVVPILIMSYLAQGSILELNSLHELRQLFWDHGWTWLTIVNTMLFSLLHFPCATTLLTIRKETGSWKWTLLSFAIPTAIAFVVCFTTAQTARLLDLV